jgi:hypothetical protein
LLKLALDVPQFIGVVERTLEAEQEQTLGIGVGNYPAGEIKLSARYENRKAISARITSTISRISPTL